MVELDPVVTPDAFDDDDDEVVVVVVVDVPETAGHEVLPLKAEHKTPKVGTGLNEDQAAERAVAVDAHETLMGALAAVPAGMQTI